MTRSFPTWTDADFTPNDIEPVKSTHSWDTFTDEETNRLLERDVDSPF